MLDEAKQKLSGKINFLLLPKVSNNTEAFGRMIEQVKKDSGSSNMNWSALTKEKQAGSLAQEWNDFIKTQNLTTVDANSMIQQLLAVKDPVEIGFIQQSSQFTCYLMRKLISQVEHSIDQNIKVKHSDLSKKIEGLIESVSEKQKFLTMGLQEGSYELGQSPIVQSGGSYQFSNVNAQTSNQTLSTDVIILQVCGQVNAYNAIVTRTLFIDPVERQKRIYNHILEVHQKTCQSLISGVKINDIYTQVKKIWDSKKSDLDLPEFPIVLGYGIGLEYREVIIQINEKNDRIIEPNMIFLVQINVENLKQGQKNMNWAVSLSDIVNITNIGPQVETQSVSKLYKNISYSLQDEEEEIEEPKQQNNQTKQNSDNRGVNQASGRTRGPRNQQIQQHRLNEQQRQKHQQELQTKKQQELEERLERDGFSKEYQQTKSLELNKLNCYKQPEQIPREVKQGQIYIDHTREAILLPFQGTHIPFHVSCIKNVSKIDEGRIGASLRINFFTTETSAGNIQFPQIDGQTIFIKELQYRSRTMVRLQELINQIKQLQKKVKAEQQVERERAHTGDVEPLILNRGGRKPVFKDLKIRPTLVSGKGQGQLELHTNGLRYIYNNKDFVDIVFRNVKHYLYQSPENEIIAALHFHLISPIIIGKKKTSDVQFYCEVSGGVEHLEGRRRQQRNDEDEIEEEERQRVQRRKMHREFDAFIKSVEEAAKDYNVIFERPYREHGFEGNWNRARIFLQPTLNTLMSIVDQPFFILPLNEVELACFERVMPGIKSFDLVFVFQNYEKPVLRLESIDIKDLEGVKNWLDRMNIIFFEVAQNLVWKNVLATISKDIAGFVEDGGWSTVLGESDEEGEVEEEVEEGDSEFAPENSNEESEYSDEDDEEDGDFGEDDDEYSDGEDDEEEYSDVLDMENLSEQDSDDIQSSDDDNKKKLKGNKQPPKKNPIGKKK